ncbi:hypothetical protein COM38_26315 [Bacillus toyonensis]|uniref:Uncharacterized protein n=1 Tax=Bacillus toyonensis TaxID=155322 RepID=A0AB36T5F5_9BACI|nr:hypothetical protein CON55_17600 [Bacillus toyonensis]PEG16261.1 hypothetical protein COO04_11045 [Bacillus toyonensis]PEJ64922.1 hypothetical protein CN906_10020 [Bacillus toyonensis]PEL63167.1 hypothetical protein CN633_05625 [Bacillus toyonensis]PEN60455.1 hypothetical protein CN540_04085 [Bacillus toyonensis]
MEGGVTKPNVNTVINATKVFLNQFGIYVPSPFTHYILSRINGQVRPPPQNSAKAKKLGGGSTARKSPIGEG